MLFVELYKPVTVTVCIQLCTMSSMGCSAHCVKCCCEPTAVRIV
jgi:hypothetical protein